MREGTRSGGCAVEGTPRGTALDWSHRRSAGAAQGGGGTGLITRSGLRLEAELRGDGQESVVAKAMAVECSGRERGFIRLVSAKVGTRQGAVLAEGGGRWIAGCTVAWSREDEKGAARRVWGLPEKRPAEGFRADASVMDGAATRVGGEKRERRE
ncbi:uncharacterized protein A4U43_C09F7660 [Asparagus officinalis]|uniref:Uncharacterized protein n=1 Tax=Asparagus officinalis TaxID=4686 RepID=A0A5P1EAU1_ASPOF|nr:uncharacterized protein A4U43_C09F7660 [Asparagus officinalis]